MAFSDMVAGDGLEPMTSGLLVRIYANYSYDYTMIIENSRRCLRIIQHVFLTIINDHKPSLMATNIK